MQFSGVSNKMKKVKNFITDEEDEEETAETEANEAETHETETPEIETIETVIPETENYGFTDEAPVNEIPEDENPEEEEYSFEEEKEAVLQAKVDNQDIAISVEVAKAEDVADKTEETITLIQSKGEYDALAELGEYDPKAELHSFKNPPARLLKDYGDSNPVINRDEQKENQDKIIEVLSNFGISIQSIHGTVGPTVTLYEVVPAAGVRIAKIRNLENDIALSLAALGIRIIAPIPGKGTIGIEVPRRDPNIVSMRGWLTISMSGTLVRLKSTRVVSVQSSCTSLPASSSIWICLMRIAFLPLAVSISTVPFTATGANHCVVW